MSHLTSFDLLWYGLSFLTAAALVLYLTPLTIHVAKTFKIQDTPDGRLKKHAQATPYLGGLAIAAGFVITFSLLGTDKCVEERALGVLAGGFMMLLLGLYDDLINLRPSVKFLGQLLATAALHKAGVSIQLAALTWWGNLALTMLWVTGITNAFNIIDVMDGLAAGTACLAALFLFVISVLLGNDPVVPFMAVVLAGALTGFLRFNFTPARIFLGDTGSLFIGFMMGALTMMVSYSSHNQLAVCAPLVLLAVPIFDTAFVAFHRARRGVPFFRGSPDHFALRVTNAGASVSATVRGVYQVSTGLGVLALGLVFGTETVAGWVLGSVVAAALVASVVLSRLAPPGEKSPLAPRGRPQHGKAAGG